MNTYPIKNHKYTGSINSFYEGKDLPILDFGKKIYVLLDNELKACIPLCVAAARNPTQGSGVGEFHVLIGAKVAGRGEVIFNADRSTHLIHKVTGEKTMRLYDNLFFETPDDYTRYLNGDNNAVMRFPYVYIKDIVCRDFGYELGGSTYYRSPLQWCYDTDTARPRRVTCPIHALWIDDEGSHLELCSEKMSDGKIVKFYPDEESCRKDNTAKVVEFEDDAAPEAEKEWWIAPPAEVPVTAKTEDEARKLVEDALSRLLK